jgi:hypothetical protein
MNTSDSDETTYNWKKVSEDVDIEGLKTSAKKLSSPITVAGLSDSFGNVDNGKQYTTEHSVEDILRDLLCKEEYPTVSLVETIPSITFEGVKGATASDFVSNYKNIMEVGTILNLNAVTLNEATITNCYRVGSNFINGYSTDLNKDNIVYNENPPQVDGTSQLTGVYSLTETYSPSIIGDVRTVNSSKNYEDVKFDSGSVIIGLGSNKISLTVESPSGVYTHPEYPEYYVVSNLGSTNVNKKLSKSNVVNGTLNSTKVVSSISVTGVYPVYVNIDSGSFIEEPLEMELTASNTIEFDVPSEVASGIHFAFDYPATHSVTSFEIWNKFENKFVNYAATYESESEIVEKDINGFKYQYNRFATTGNLQGEGKYKITLSKRLDEK